MSETPDPQDTWISDAVVRELGWLPSVDSTHVVVSVTDGVVTLSGNVATYLEKVLAGKAARRIQGVIGLAQEIDVHTRWTDLSDVDIARECGEAVQRAIDVPLSVKVAVARSVVTLSGEAQWQFQREAAVRTVQCLKGVTEVEFSVPAFFVSAFDASPAVLAVGEPRGPGRAQATSGEQGEPYRDLLQAGVVPRGASEG